MVLLRRLFRRGKPSLINEAIQQIMHATSERDWVEGAKKMGMSQARSRENVTDIIFDLEELSEAPKEGKN